MNKQHTRPVRRVLAVILSLALLLTFTPLSGVVTLSASAEEEYTHLSENTRSVSGTVGVFTDIAISHWIELSGDTILYIESGCTLNIGGGGIIVGRGHDLTICGEGTIEGYPASSGIIGVNNIVIESGKIKWQSVSGSTIKATNVTVNGGNIWLESTQRYGIEATNAINLNGGIIHANKYSADHIYINGLEVQASQINNKTLQLGYKTITWQNYDGSTLKTEQVNCGETPSYSGETPTKPATEQYTYTFSGWSPAVTAVTEDQTYTAQFSSTVKKYTVTWKNSDDSTLKTEQVNYGETPSYSGETPTKASDGKYNYTFSGWSPAITTVSGNVTYTAEFTKTPIATHFSQEGDSYTIHNDTGWDIFCDCLDDNDTYNRFSGKTVVLADDITVTRMASGADHDFKGIFDGQGHTLTVAYGTADSPVSDDDKAAPFRNVESGCVIKNLHTQGTIYTSKKYAGGIVGTQYGTVRLENCRSSVTINSMTAGDGTHGGLVGRNGSSSSAKLTIDGCVFDGKILSVGDDPTTNCASFVGYKGNNVTITNSIYAPKALEADETEPAGNSATFVRNGSAGANCYYTRTLGTAQGKQAYTITAGDDVTLGLAGEATEYGVSGITAYADSNGIKYGETTLCAGSGDTVTLTVAPSAVGYAVNSVSVNDGAVAVTSNENGTYSFTMPASNAAVTAELEEASYFDASTGTLTLKGTIHNNKGIVLPDGVNKADVLLINVDSSGATLPQDSAWLFQFFYDVKSIDLTGADTSGVTSMNGMFWSCSDLTELDLSSFDTSNVTDMTNMFAWCDNLTELDLSSFDTSSVTNMTHMFAPCSELKTIYVSDKWNTGSVTISGNMFSGCTKLKGGNGTAFDLDYIDKTYAVIDKDGQPGYLTGVYTLTLPNHMEIATDADENMKLGSRYLKGAVVTVRYTGEVKEGYSLIVSANGIALPEENGVYTITITDSNVAVTAVVDVESTFDASTGTLTLKGTVLNGGYGMGIVLPDGVNKAAVLHIDVDSSGATLPRDSSSLFQKFTNVTSIDLTGADTRNVTNMSCMFYYCENLTELDLSSFDTSRVSDMSFMFSGCGHLTELNLSSFDTRNVTEMNSMFFGCFLLETIYVSEQWRTESVIFSTEMFENCGLLTGGNGTAFDLDYTDKTYAVIDKDGQPGYLTGVYTLTLPDHMEIVTDADENMKLGSRYLKGAVVTVRYTGEVKEGYSLIASANGIALPEENGVYTITIPDSNVAVTAVVDVESTFDASTGTLTLKGTIHNNKGIVLPDGVNKADVLLINVDSSGATLPQDSARLFYNFTNVTSIDLTGADTRNVTKMNYMFYCCENLTELDLSSFDTGNVTNMSYMFDCCNNLTELDLSSFDTGNVTDMNYMFFSCENLTELDLSSFDTGNVTDMNSMFDCCNNLTELDLSSFDTSFVNYMAGMFSGCEHLTELNLSSFDTSSVTIMSFMFGNCMELKTIYVSDKWNTGSVTNSGNMFSSCTNLKGGNGTAYDGTKTDKTYAVIDKDGQPGYLTGTYAVTVPAGITISPVNAIIDSVPFFVKGETITISPGEGYIIADAFVFIDLGYGIIDIEITDNNDGTYSFTMPEGNVSMEVVTAFTDGIGAALAGHSISLEGDIGVNFYMDLDPEIARSETAYMQFTIPNGSKSETKTVFVKDAREEGGYYIFKCSVAAKDMSSEISAQLIDGDKTSTVYTYSVREYADWLIEHKNDSAAYKKAAPLVEKMLRYGAYAKEYFDKTNTLPDLGDVNIDSQFATYTSSLPEGLYSGATLSLKSKTTLSLYFTDEDALTFTCVDENGAERTVETVRNGSTQIARIRNIAAKELKDSFTVTVKRGETELGTITYSPMNYCYKALNGSTENENLINAVKALVAYSDAANEYFKAGV